jgi:hypothetical protein
MTITNFIRGERVVCVDESLNSYLKEDEVYTVDAVYAEDWQDEQYLYLQEVSHPQAAFRGSRFVYEGLEKPAMKTKTIASDPWVMEEAAILKPTPVETELAAAQIANLLMAADAVQAEAPLDAVTLPQHYARFKIEPIRFICENQLNFFQGNIVKYILRHDAKNGLEDLKKARRYLDMFIKYMDKDPDWWRA